MESLIASMLCDEERIAKFWSYVNKAGPNDCWEWQASRNKGYGQFQVDGLPRGAHQIAFELTYGYRDRNLDVCHNCNNRACCNPSHLRQDTRSNNHLDKPLKDHCGYGHKFSDTGLKIMWINGNQRRYCRECIRINKRKYHKKRREQGLE